MKAERGNLGFAVSLALLCLVVNMADAQNVQLRPIKKENYVLEGKKLKLGKFDVMPNFFFRSIIDDNALFSDGHTATDCIFELRPGVDVTARGRNIDFRTGYKFNWHENVKLDIQDYVAHDFGGEVYTTPFGRRFHLRVSDYLKDSSEPADAEIMERLYIFSNELAAEMGYMSPGEDIEFTVGYINSYKDYEGLQEGANFYGDGIQVSSRVNLSSKYRFLPKTQANFDFNYVRGKQNFGVNVFNRPVNSEGYRFLAGLTGSFTKKLSLNLGFGYSRLDFDVAQTASEFITDIGVDYMLSKKLSLSAGYSRSINYSIYSPYSVIDGYKAEISYSPSKKLKASLKLDMRDLKYSGPPDNGAGNNRGDFNTMFSIEVNYRLKGWLSLVTGYHLENRISNLVSPVASSGDFLRNTYYLGIGFNYF